MPTRLMEFLTSKPGQEEDQKKEALLGKLKEINDYLVLLLLEMLYRVMRAQLYVHRRSALCVHIAIVDAVLCADQEWPTLWRQ